jgi:hypothetical protein
MSGPGAVRSRRLLVVSYFFPPLSGGGVHRVLGFVRDLPRFGWECTVVCAGREDYWVTDETLESQVPEGIEVIRTAGGSAISAWLRLRHGERGRRAGGTFSLLRGLSDFWLLPDSYVGWSRRAARVVERRLGRGDVDCVLSSSPPDSAHLAVLHARRARFARPGATIPWVADFRDPWIGLYLREPPSVWHRARQAALERCVLDDADLVLAASRTHADGMGEKSGSRPRRVVHLPNGYAPETVGETNSAAAEPGTHFLMVFTGTLSQLPETEQVLEALHELLARRPELRRRVRARFAGPYDLGYPDRAVALGLTGIVEFTGAITHARSRALQREADLLLLWKPAHIRTMVPGKLYEYLETGRPLLAMLPAGDEAAELAERGGATVVRPGDREALASALERAVDEWRERGRAPDRRNEWIESHARPRLAERLARELDALVAPVPAPEGSAT